jgi:hypothetical protein
MTQLCSTPVASTFLQRDRSELVIGQQVARDRDGNAYVLPERKPAFGGTQIATQISVILRTGR